MAVIYESQECVYSWVQQAEHNNNQHGACLWEWFCFFTVHHTNDKRTFIIQYFATAFLLPVLSLSLSSTLDLWQHLAHYWSTGFCLILWVICRIVQCLLITAPWHSARHILLSTLWLWNKGQVKWTDWEYILQDVTAKPFYRKWMIMHTLRAKSMKIKRLKCNLWVTLRLRVNLQRAGFSNIQYKWKNTEWYCFTHGELAGSISGGSWEV